MLLVAEHRGGATLSLSLYRHSSCIQEVPKHSLDTHVAVLEITHSAIISDSVCKTKQNKNQQRKPVSSDMSLEAWYMDSSEDDQRKPHRLSPNQPVSLDHLKTLGVFYWKVTLTLQPLAL